jgi:hypothetical protein
MAALKGESGRLYYHVYLVKNWRYHILIYHRLIGCRRKDLVEMIYLVAQRACSHRQFNLFAFNAVGGNNYAAVFFDLALVATSTSNNYMDIRLFALALKFSLFSLGSSS